MNKIYPIVLSNVDGLNYILLVYGKAETSDGIQGVSLSGFQPSRESGNLTLTDNPMGVMGLVGLIPSSERRIIPCIDSAGMGVDRVIHFYMCCGNLRPKQLDALVRVYSFHETIITGVGYGPSVRSIGGEQNRYNQIDIYLRVKRYIGDRQVCIDFTVYPDGIEESEPVEFDNSVN